MRKPAILRRGELYLSPIEVLEVSASEPAWLVKDEPLEAVFASIDGKPATGVAVAGFSPVF